MTNKIKLKKLLLILFITTITFTVINIIINKIEYQKYTLNYNIKISSIVETITSKYPNIEEIDIVKILNSDNNDTNPLKQYGFDISKDSFIKENDSYYKKYIVINTILFIFTSSIIIALFLLYNHNKDKEISEITKYIEEINNKNYSLKIEDLSEDELSILKNEIYKTTVMLKEQASNSITDKINLKKSLEDISHQLKTPLTSILITLDNLINNPTMSKELREEFLSDIKREIININSLVQSLLKLSKLDSNTIEFNNKKIKVSSIIKESIKKVSPICDLYNIKIVSNGNENSTILCDKNWQVEAITNILKNCLEHSKPHSQIDIMYKSNNIFTEISIRDYGVGISKKDLSHIFERFYKGENSKKDSIGIGLSLSKSIIEQNNGTIKVESIPNKGTTFKIKYFK